MSKKNENIQHGLWIGSHSQRKLTPNTIYNADNLEVMKQLPSDSIDLIYIDPPFTTQAVQKGRAFDDKVCLGEYDDKWGGGINSFVIWLSVRLREMHRLLKPTGVLCVHLDYRAVHYIKIELDKIFGNGQVDKGAKHLVNELIWSYKSGGNTKKHFGKKHDNILVYSKTKKYTFNFDEISEKRGREKRNNMKRITENGEVFYTIKSNGKTYKYSEHKKMVPTDVFEIPHIQQKSPERLGYPTQKPIALLERLIKAFSNTGDIIADFFCGCGTTIDAATKLNRFFIGVDASRTAAQVMRERMLKQHNLRLRVQTLKSLTKAQVFSLGHREFENYMILQIGGIPNQIQVNDGGVDGKMQDGTPIQVKKSDKVGRPVIDSFHKHLEYNGRGIIIAKSFTRTAKEECAKLLRQKGWEVTLMTTDDILKSAS